MMMGLLAGLMRDGPVASVIGFQTGVKEAVNLLNICRQYCI